VSPLKKKTKAFKGPIEKRKGLCEVLQEKERLLHKKKERPCVRPYEKKKGL